MNQFYSWKLKVKICLKNLKGVRCSDLREISLSPQTSNPKQAIVKPKTIDHFFNKKMKPNNNEIEAFPEQERDDDIELSTRFFVCPHCFIYYEGNNDFYIQHIDFCIE